MSRPFVNLKLPGFRSLSIEETLCVPSGSHGGLPLTNYHGKLNAYPTIGASPADVSPSTAP